MRKISIYSTVSGDLPKLVRDGVAKTFIPYQELLRFKEEVLKIALDQTHTPYQNKCYLDFLLRKLGKTEE